MRGWEEGMESHKGKEKQTEGGRENMRWGPGDQLREGARDPSRTMVGAADEDKTVVTMTVVQVTNWVCDCVSTRILPFQSYC